jgi:hypothetical protein
VFGLSDIFQEIDEELRRENFVKLWQRYSIYVYVLAAVIVVATGGVVGWRQYQLTQRQAEGARYSLALDLLHQGKDKDAGDIFAELARQAGGGDAILARFEEAALKARAGDTKSAVALYDALATDRSADPIYRDLATLLGAQYELKDGDAKGVIERVARLTSADSPWHPTALELTALAQLKEGNQEEALATYQRLAEDPASPQGVRARATEILGSRASPSSAAATRLGQ